MEDLLKIEAEKKAFFAKYPDVKRSENIKCLDLIMKKEFAKAILNGEKTVEFRKYSRHYVDRLYDKKLLNYGEINIPDEDMEDFVDFARPLRKVEKIHFHDYNNSWSLDVEVTDNWTIGINDEDVSMLHELFDCHELDTLLSSTPKHGESEHPDFFYFAIGKIITHTGL